MSSAPAIKTQFLSRAQPHSALKGQSSKERPKCFVKAGVDIGGLFGTTVSQTHKNVKRPCLICMDDKPLATMRFCRVCDSGAVCAGCYRKCDVGYVSPECDLPLIDERSIKCPACRSRGCYGLKGLKQSKVKVIKDADTTRPQYRCYGIAEDRIMNKAIGDIDTSLHNLLTHYETKAYLPIKEADEHNKLIKKDPKFIALEREEEDLDDEIEKLERQLEVLRKKSAEVATRRKEMYDKNKKGVEPKVVNACKVLTYNLLAPKIAHEVYKSLSHEHTSEAPIEQVVKQLLSFRSNTNDGVRDYGFYKALSPDEIRLVLECSNLRETLDLLDDLQGLGTRIMPNTDILLHSYKKNFNRELHNSFHFATFGQVNYPSEFENKIMVRVDTTMGRYALSTDEYDKIIREPCKALYIAITDFHSRYRRLSGGVEAPDPVDSVKVALAGLTKEEIMAYLATLK